MWTAALICCLSADGPNDYPVRAAAEQWLSVHAVDSTIREAARCSPDPDVRATLGRVVRRIVLRDLDSALGDSLYWPDCDSTRWAVAETAWDAENGRWENPWHELRRYNYTDDTVPMWGHGEDWGDRAAAYAAPVYSPWRERTRRCLYTYLCRTGDWEYARNCIASALLSENTRRSLSEQADTQEALRQYAPHLLNPKGRGWTPWRHVR